eukprot:COSAG05_NODE_1846_length_3968_cov_36.682605_2_plen_86_part_00
MFNPSHFISGVSLPQATPDNQRCTYTDPHMDAPTGRNHSTGLDGGHFAAATQLPGDLASDRGGFTAQVSPTVLGTGNCKHVGLLR